MATEVGPKASYLKDSVLEEQLAEKACAFEFFQAVTLLERLAREGRPVGSFSHPAEEAVHFKANPRLGFPASEIQSLAMHEDAPPEMTVNFMGLTGPSGDLPYTYSELMLERMRAKDRGLAAFFDIFNHRSISLFYRAWQRSRFPVTYSAGPRDLFTRYLLDLIGLGTDGLRDRQEIEDEALLHYVSLLAMQSRSATALEQLIEDYFEVPVEIEQFVGAWYALDKATQCAMTEVETPSRQVGGGAVVGDAVWERQARVRVRLGPLPLDRYCDFLPGARGYRSLQALTRFFTSDCVEFELQLVLDRTHAPGTALDFEAAVPARLGWVSWLSTAPLGNDPDDTILTL
jgi:type VI secretion system protein ImpH